jgi:hypothetical protein
MTPPKPQLLLVWLAGGRIGGLLAQLRVPTRGYLSVAFGIYL